MESHSLLHASEAKRGGALLFSVVAISVIAALAAASFQLTVASTKQQASAIQQRSALYIAEAGLAESYAGLMQGRTGNVGSEQSPASFGEGLFWVEATARTDGTVQLDSTGMVRGGMSKLSLVVHPGGLSVSALGLFSSDELILPAGSTVDGYDSRLGSYLPGEGFALGIEGRVGSNQAIQIAGTVAQPTLIQADIIAGPGSAVSLGANVVVEGESGSAYQTIELPAATLPLMPDASGTDVSGVVPLVVLPKEEVQASLKVRPGSEVVLKGPGVFAYESLTVAETGTLVLDATEGHVSLFVDGNVEMALGSILATDAKTPLDVSFVITGAPAVPCKLGATGEFRGALYAPDADLQIGEGLEFFGALVAKSLEFQGAARIHIDQALTTAAAEEWLPKVVSWQILEMAPGRRVGGRVIENPFEAMGVEPANLSPPAEAHPEQILEIEYLDQMSSQRSYSGAESSFDWSDVETLISASRDGQPFVRPTDDAVLNPSPAVEEGVVDSLDAVSEALIEEVNDDKVKSKDLKKLLEDNSPLSDAVLLAAINRRKAMKSGDLDKVFKKNRGAGDLVWIRALDAVERTDKWDIEKHFVAIAPSSAAVLEALAKREEVDHKFKDKDLQKILDAQ